MQGPRSTRRDSVTFFIAPAPSPDGADDIQSPRLLTPADAVDLVFLFQPRGEVLVACLDHHRHVVLVAEVDPAEHDCLPPVLGELEMIDEVVVLTAIGGGRRLREDDVIRFHELRDAYARVGLEMIDWINVDHHATASMAELTGTGDPWRGPG